MCRHNPELVRPCDCQETPRTPLGPPAVGVAPARGPGEWLSRAGIWVSGANAPPMPSSALHDERVNAALGWAMTAVVALAGLGSALAGGYLWAGFALTVVVAASLPAVGTRSATAMVPWPLLFVAAVAVVIRAAGVFPDPTGYLAVSAVALILVVELDVYTGVELSRRFAVAFATMTTLALQAFWIIAQYYSDRWLGTEFLVSQVELQWDIVAVTAVAVALGVLTIGYVEWLDPAGSFASLSSG